MNAKRLIIFISLAFLSEQKLCFAQSAITKIESIKAYINRIDSLIPEDEVNIRTMIEEGSIKTVTSVSKRSIFKIKRYKPIIRIGGFGTEIYYNSKKDTIYKISYHDNKDQNYYEDYYYIDNKLVAADVSIRNDGGKETLLGKREYYDKDKIIFQSTYTSSQNPDYLSRLSFSFFTKGTKIFIEALNKIRPQ